MSTPLLHFNARRVLAALAIAISTVSSPKTQSATFDWLVQPKPAFPASALATNAQGVVRLRVIVDAKGNVDHAVITKSSGNKELDEAGQRAVLSWRMKPRAVKASDVTEGRAVAIDFREEAAVAARYPGGVVASFEHFDATGWRSAPFPEYPIEARMNHQEGTVRLKANIGSLGNVTQVGLLQSSGHKVLDDAAIVAVRHWKAQPKYAGQAVAFPVRFQMQYR